MGQQRLGAANPEPAAGQVHVAPVGPLHLREAGAEEDGQQDPEPPILGEVLEEGLGLPLREVALPGDVPDPEAREEEARVVAQLAALMGELQHLAEHRELLADGLAGRPLAEPGLDVALEVVDGEGGDVVAAEEAEELAGLHAHHLPGGVGEVGAAERHVLLEGVGDGVARARVRGWTTRSVGLEGVPLGLGEEEAGELAVAGPGAEDDPPAVGGGEEPAVERAAGLLLVEPLAAALPGHEGSLVLLLR
ncbi:MAG: hypothetical protein NDI82_00285 [Anaeromyxobacteraceae bacterium]|nr:hypothetical protein [Anaeromyxobacteraceae bacterium]